MAAFYSADYDEDEEGFRYNADIQYKIDADQWLEEIREEQLYDTGIDAEFGDEFITLTTCERSRHKEGRFVLILRKLREGETVE
jgi:sortase B